MVLDAEADEPGGAVESSLEPAKIWYPQYRGGGSGDFFEDCDEANLGDLDSDIHPIFARRNFPGAHHDTLLPSLRLASKLLTTECLLPWWHAIFFGRREEIPNTRKYNRGKMYCYFRKPGKLSPRDIAMTRLRLQTMSDYVRFFRSENLLKTIPANGVTDYSIDRLEDMINYTDIEGCGADIGSPLTSKISSSMKIVTPTL